MKKVFYELKITASGFAFVPVKGKSTKSFTSKRKGLDTLNGLMGKDPIKSRLTMENIWKLLINIKDNTELNRFETEEENQNEEMKNCFDKDLEKFISNVGLVVRMEYVEETGTPELYVCSVFNHAHIIVSDEVVEHITHKTQGKYYVVKLHNEEKIDNAGSIKLIREINASNLPENAPDPVRGRSGILLIAGLNPRSFLVTQN